MFYDQLLCMQIPEVQKYSQAISFFVLLGSAHKKVSSKSLMKLTPVVNFINIFCEPFSYKSLFSSYDLALNKLWYKKCVHKTLMKLTPGILKINTWQYLGIVYDYQTGKI